MSVDCFTIISASLWLRSGAKVSWRKLRKLEISLKLGAPVASLILPVYSMHVLNDYVISLACIAGFFQILRFAEMAEVGTETEKPRREEGELYLIVK